MNARLKHDRCQVCGRLEALWPCHCVQTTNAGAIVTRRVRELLRERSAAHGR